MGVALEEVLLSLALPHRDPVQNKSKSRSPSVYRSPTRFPSPCRAEACFGSAGTLTEHCKWTYIEVYRTLIPDRPVEERVMPLTDLKEWTSVSPYTTMTTLQQHDGLLA